MKYRSNKQGDFFEVEGRFYEVERQYFSDADAVADILVPDMFERLGTRKVGMKILTIGDQRFILGSFPFEDSGEHIVQLSEVRQDNKGIHFKTKIPFINAQSHLPIISLLGSMGEVQINTAPGENLGSIAQIVQQGINETLVAAANNQTEEFTG